MTPACTKTRELLDDALDGRLDAALRAELDRHVEACPSCAAEWELASSLRDSLLRIGLDRAPAGLRESIAAEVQKTGARAPKTVAFSRAAAAILAIATIAWLSLRSQKTGHSRADSAAPALEKTERSREEELAVNKNKARPAAPAQAIRTVPGEQSWNVDVPAGSVALARVRELVDSGGEGAGDVSRYLEPGVTPEQRIRQAEALVMLHQNFRELTEAAGEAPALSELAKDADGALEVFSDKAATGKLVAKENAALARDEEATEKKAEAQDSASKVMPAPPAAGARRGGAAGAKAAAPEEPAFYVVSGPGAVGRVERVLHDRGLEVQEVWLKDQGENVKKQKLDEEATAYRIVEVQVPADVLNDLIGDLESLPSLQLSPVGRGYAAPAAPPVLAKGPTGGGGGGKARGAPESSAAKRQMADESDRNAPRADQPKSLGIRKLRLILISR